MTAHNDIRYLQTQYGVLDRTRFGEVADRYTFVGRRRNQIADITRDKIGTVVNFVCERA
jgi:hypothetical protein